MEIIQVKDSRHESYVALLMKRDQCRKEAGSLWVSYVKTFGGLYTQAFEKKIECIRKKKEISYCQAMANRGKKVDLRNLHRFIDSEMAEYYSRLNSMMQEYSECKMSKAVSEGTYYEIRKAFKRIAKRLHPDVNPETSVNETLKDLWQSVQDAYNQNNLRELKELEVLVDAALEQLGFGELQIDIPDIEDRIKELEDEIDTIIHTNPYQYKLLLGDIVAVEEHKNKLREEIISYSELAENLDEVLMEFDAGCEEEVTPWMLC